VRPVSGTHTRDRVRCAEFRAPHRAEVEPDDVEDLLHECGLRSNAFQIRPMLERDNPLRSAIFARDQCVAFAGVDSKVATTTSSTCSAVIEVGRPGRGSSASPSRRASTNRARHLPTICTETPSSSATAVFDRPLVVDFRITLV
jgi:hypothetical protein